MDFDFSEDQYALRDEARRFLGEQCPPARVREFLDDPSAWSRGLYRRMAELGWTALPFPEEHGGLGRGFLDLVLLLVELGRCLAPVPFTSSVALAGQSILLHGSEEQRERLLPAIASGERVAALAVAEPAGAFAEEGVETRAEPDGAAWRLFGSKHFVLDAPAADLFVVAARADEGVGWYVCDEGAVVEPQAGFDPTRPIGRVVLEGVRAEALASGGLEPGLRVATAALCAEAIGTGERVLEMTVDYAKVREQFGRPIGSFQAIKHKCAEMLTDLEAARAGAFSACWAVAAGAADADLFVSVAKSFCGDALGRIGAEGVQVHGGIAFTWEHDMHLYLKRIKSVEAIFGTAAAHRERIARLVGL